LKVPEVVVSRLGLGNLAVRLWFACVNDIRKFDGILDEEDGNVVAHDVPVALLCVELDSKAAYITNGVC